MDRIITTAVPVFILAVVPVMYEYVKLVISYLVKAVKIVMNKVLSNRRNSDVIYVPPDTGTVRKLETISERKGNPASHIGTDSIKLGGQDGVLLEQRTDP